MSIRRYKSTQCSFINVVDRRDGMNEMETTWAINIHLIELTINLGPEFI